MGMKATHKLVSKRHGTEWELSQSEGQLFYRKITQPTSGGWFGSVSTLDRYESNPDFFVTKLKVFKGNK